MIAALPSPPSSRRRGDPRADAASSVHSFGLDVVRCGAILLVLACHCGLVFTAWNLVPRPPYLDALGYYGVELFFVLSGFLIGGLLLDIVGGRPDLRDWAVFMTRRWLRTLPLYFLCLAILAAAWPLGLTHEDWRSTWRLLPAYASFTQNFAWPQPDWFPVSWSLSIEEWFYLSFSSLLLLGARLLGGRRALVVTLSVFIGGPLLLRAVQPPSVNWNEYLHKAVVLRLDAIAIGVATIATVRARRRPPPVRGGLLAAGSAMSLAQAGGVLPFGQETRLSRAVGFDVTDVGFALTLPGMARLPKPSAWLEAPTRLFAAQAYGTYLTHYTIMEMIGFARFSTHWSGTFSVALATALIIVVPVLSWHGFEKPLLRLRPRARPFPRRPAPTRSRRGQDGPGVLPVVGDRGRDRA